MEVTPLGDGVLYATDDHDGYGNEEIIPIRLDDLLVTISVRGKENYIYCRKFPRRLVVNKVAAAQFISDMQAAMPALFETRLMDDRSSRVLVNTDSIDWEAMKDDLYLIRRRCAVRVDTRFLNEREIRVQRSMEPLRKQISIDSAEWIKMCRHAGSPVPYGECFDGCGIKDAVYALVQSKFDRTELGGGWKALLNSKLQNEYDNVRQINDNVAAEILARGNFSLLKIKRPAYDNKWGYWTWVNLDHLDDQRHRFAVSYCMAEDNGLYPDRIRTLAMRGKDGSVNLSCICAEENDVRRLLQGKRLPETVLKAWGMGTSGRVLTDTNEVLPCYDAEAVMKDSCNSSAQDIDGTVYNLETLSFPMTLHGDNHYAAKGARCRIIQLASQDGWTRAVESYVSEPIFRQMTHTAALPDEEQAKITPVRIFATHKNGNFCRPAHILALVAWAKGEYMPVSLSGEPLNPVSKAMAEKIMQADDTDWRNAGRKNKEADVILNLAGAYSGRILMRMRNSTGAMGVCLVNIAGDAVVLPSVFWDIDPEIIDELNMEAKKYEKS